MSEATLPFPVIPSDRLDDLNGLEHADSADLVIFMAGNQFMVMAELMTAFRKTCPEVRRVFYETLPPGLELKQILAGGAMFRNQPLQLRPDVYTSVHIGAMETLAQSGHRGEEPPVLYLHNRLAIMVPAGNPAGIRQVADLGRDHLRVSQPDPANEDIAHHIVRMYRQAGGDPLVHRIMEEKRANGTTLFTVVHHRETPQRIVGGDADAGPVWATEIIHARKKGLAVEAVEPGPDLDQRHRINYYACRLAHGANPENAEQFIHFLSSTTAGKIYEHHGFVSHESR